MVSPKEKGDRPLFIKKGNSAFFLGIRTKRDSPKKGACPLFSFFLFFLLFSLGLTPFSFFGKIDLDGPLLYRNGRLEL